jgi:adenosylhomocysteine nucleosidase
MRVGIIAALPGELKPLVRGWEASFARDGTHKWVHRENASVWIAVCSGMGADAARRAFAEAEADGPLDMVLSVGWAGGLIPELQPGEARTMSHIVDAQTGEQFALTDGKGRLTLVTAARVADEAEKRRLRQTYSGAVMVDMEAATVARMAQMRKIPIGCIKGVSDNSTALLPDLNRFLSQHGQLRLFPFVMHILLRPKYWRPVAQLGRNSARAAQAICGIILKFMEEKNVERLNRTGHP